MDDAVARLDAERGAHQVRFVAADDRRFLRRSGGSLPRRRPCDQPVVATRTVWRGGSGRVRREWIGLGFAARSHRDRPRAGCRAAGDSRWVNRPGSRNNAPPRKNHLPLCQMRAIVADRATQRQHAADRTRPARGRTRAPAVRVPAGSRELRVLGQHVGRQAMLAPEVVVDVLVGRLDQRRIDLQPLGQRGAEPRGVGGAWRCRCRFGRPAAQDRARPARRPRANARRAPSAAVARPDSACRTRSAARRPAPRAAQPAHQLVGEALLGRTERVGVPFRRVEVGGGDEGRLAAHGQPHVAGGERAIHRGAHRQDVLPLRVGVRLGDARRLAHARQAHVEAEFGFARLDQPADRRGGLRIGRGGERDVALAGQQAGGGVEADPAGARQICLRPGVQVGEVGGRAFRAFERLHVGDELDQVAGDEARRVAELAQQLHQQPGGVAAGAFARGQRLLRRPDAGLHAHDVGDAALHHAVERDQHVHGVAARRAAPRSSSACRQRAHRRRAGGTAPAPARAPGRS